jgi:hypothetical protein
MIGYPSHDGLLSGSEIPGSGGVNQFSTLGKYLSASFEITCRNLCILFIIKELYGKEMQSPMSYERPYSSLHRDGEANILFPFNLR